MSKPKTAISPTRQENYPEWYQQVIQAAELAESSPARGCMVIKPWGYGLWENMQKVLDRMFKETGHQNAYFPLFIPLSFFEREAEHVEGFAKECAIVTHHRLQADGEGRLVPTGELEEPLVVRPTSETIIGAMFSKWTQSYRDLPLLINQWANVVRWEMRPRIFLRTAEFLWQEGHTAHASEEEAKEETLRMLDIYAHFAEHYMALPVVKGEKCSWERFPGAVSTYTIEAMMQDHKALQAGTSHFLGQNFARASEIKYLSKEGCQEYAWTTSWGVSTRLIGALIMAHSDDDGFVVPPRLAPVHVVILPIIRDEEQRQGILEHCQRLATEIRAQSFDGIDIQVEIDSRDISGGEKVWHHIKRGVPIRLEIGPREVESDSVFMKRRDQSPKERQTLPRAELVSQVGGILTSIQESLYARALECRDASTRRITDRKKLEKWFTPKNPQSPEIHGGFAICPFVDDPRVKQELGKLNVTVRCLPLDQERKPARCIITGEETDRWAIFAKAY